MNFGIDAISFYTPNYYLDLKTFALGRGQEPARFYEDLGQKKMSIAPPNEDIVTLAANAVEPLLRAQDVSAIEMVIVATETGIDLSKAAATYIHKLFNLPPRCRIIELKQACYSATFGLQLGLNWLRQHINKKILLIAADIAHYKFNSPAESSQGSGAVAMLLSANPRLLSIEPEAGFCTQEAMDFWRPNYLDHALVDGRLSCELYIRLAIATWQQYSAITGHQFTEHDRFCYHVPVPKLVETTHKKLAKLNGLGNLTLDQLEYHIGHSLLYNREVGNCYTASLYLSILSLLENVTQDLGNKLIGLYSYGSGSIGEFFAARVVPGYQKWLLPRHHELLKQRQELTMAEYEAFYSFQLPTTGQLYELPQWQTGKLRLKAVQQYQRIYENVG